MTRLSFLFAALLASASASAQTWTPLPMPPEAVTSISVINPARAMATGVSRAVYRWNGASWTKVNGALAQVAYSDAQSGTQLWGVDGSGRIYGGSGSLTEQVSGSLKQIAVGHGQTWGVNSDGNVYQWGGT